MSRGTQTWHRDRHGLRNSDSHCESHLRSIRQRYASGGGFPAMSEGLGPALKSG